MASEPDEEWGEEDHSADVLLDHAERLTSAERREGRARAVIREISIDLRLDSHALLFALDDYVDSKLELFAIKHGLKGED